MSSYIARCMILPEEWTGEAKTASGDMSAVVVVVVIVQCGPRHQLLLFVVVAPAPTASRAAPRYLHK